MRGPTYLAVALVSCSRHCSCVPAVFSSVREASRLPCTAACLLCQKLLPKLQRTPKLKRATSADILHDFSPSLPASLMPPKEDPIRMSSTVQDKRSKKGFRRKVRLKGATVQLTNPNTTPNLESSPQIPNAGKDLYKRPQMTTQCPNQRTPPSEA